MDSSVEPCLRALPAQVVADAEGAFIRRGTAAIRVMGERSVAAVRQVLAMAAEGRMTKGEICEAFTPADREAVEVLVTRLIRERVLVPAPENGSEGGDPAAADPSAESAAEVLYWDLDLPTLETKHALSNAHTVVCGRNPMGDAVVASLRQSDLTRLTVVDVPELRRGETSFTSDLEVVEAIDSLATETIDCVVAASDLDAFGLLRNLHESCWERGIPFLPVVLGGLVGHVGPLVLPEETPCLECYLARRTATAGDFVGIDQASDQTEPPVPGYHAAMPRLLAEVVVLELFKFYAGWRAALPTGACIEVSFLYPEVRIRRFLRAPRCHLCSETARRPRASFTVPF